MTKEDKQLLLIDLCGRLPYGVKIYRALYEDVTLSPADIESFLKGYDDILMPYLRPMSSMTEEEYKELKSISSYYSFAPYEFIYDWSPNYNVINWLNAHHFDYRKLIEKNLALDCTGLHIYKYDYYKPYLFVR